MPPEDGKGNDVQVPLRITLILTEFPPRVGGMQTHALALAKKLWDIGHAVQVITYRCTTAIERAEAPRLDASLPFEVKRQLSRISHEFNLRRCEKIISEFGSDLVYASTIFFGELEGRCGIPVTARSVGNDVLRPWIAYPFQTGSSLMAAPWVENHAYRFFRQLNYPEFLESVWRAARRRRMEDSARKHSKIFANSEFTSELLQHIGLSPEKIQMVVGGVDVERFGRAPEACSRQALGLPEDAYILLTACRLVRKKAVDFLIESLPEIVARIPHACLVIVGGGQREKHLRGLAAQSPCSERIIFAGRIPQETIEAYFWAADQFVLASREWVEPVTGLRDVETMGRVLCEANAAGLPVVAARSGGIPSVIEDQHNGLLFEPDHRPSFLRAVTRVYQDGELRQTLVRNGRAVARDRFAFSHVVDAHLSSFREIVEKSDVQECPGADDTALPREVRVVFDPHKKPTVSGDRRPR